MSTEISLDELFKEQSAVDLFLVKPFNEEFVYMSTWSPGDSCGCQGFRKVPRSAIRSVRKTGKTIQCCGKLMEIVTVEFSEEPTLTYAALFAGLRIAKARRGKPRNIRRPIKPRPPDPHQFPIIMPFPWPEDGEEDTGGGSGNDTEETEQCLQQCLKLYLKNPPDGMTTISDVNQWILNILELCGDLCQGDTIIQFGPSDDD